MSKPQEKIIDDVNYLRALVNDCLFAAEDGKYAKAHALSAQIEVLANSIPMRIKAALPGICSARHQQCQVEGGVI